MASPIGAHPDTATLDAFATGRLSGDEMDRVAKHIEGCGECSPKIDGLNDEFVDRLRYAARTIRIGAGKGPVTGNGAAGLISIPGYMVLGELGRGGMGIVYRAMHEPLQREVAIKVLREGGMATADELARFRAEAGALARVRHPNIVQIFDVGEWRSPAGTALPFFTMEYLPAGPLSRRLSGLPQPSRAAARFVELLARAVESAHQAGVVHRDLKPGNILIDAGTTPSEDFQLETAVPKIVDFGLAKWAERPSGATGSGAVLGTPGYMAPEQAAGRTRDVGVPSDIHALGVILYELLTGRPPFQGETPAETFIQVITRPAVPPRQLVPVVPRDLETITLKCLEKEPAQRYASAADLAADLHRFQAGEAIRAKPPSPFQRCAKFTKRNKALVAGTVATLTALVAGTVISVLLAIGESEARRRADDNALAADRDRRAALRGNYQARLAASRTAEREGLRRR